MVCRYIQRNRNACVQLVLLHLLWVWLDLMDASFCYRSDIGAVWNHTIQSFQALEGYNVTVIDAIHDYVPVHLRHGVILRAIQYCIIWRTRLYGHALHFLRTEVRTDRRKEKEECRWVRFWATRNRREIARQSKESSTWPQLNKQNANPSSPRRWNWRLQLRWSVKR